MKKIGFIGLGVMGGAIVTHLLQAGFELHVYNRTQAKMQPYVALGAISENSPQEVAAHAEIIFTMVGFPQDVKYVYFGENGIFKSDIAGKYLVDLTTSTPTLAKEIFQEATLRGAHAMDAPVSGGDLGAKNGTLTMMVGGNLADFEILTPIFEIFTSTLNLQGPAGSGQHTKMANQIMIAGTMTGLTELLVYAYAAGLDLEKVLATVGGGSAANWSLTNYAPRILAQDFTPGFFVKHFVKDLKIALDEAEKMNLQLPATQQALKMYEELAKDYPNSGTQSLIKLFWPEGTPKK
ncbi:NAD(P)-dependent oxidoreductase [Enterococcus timonensis]|uniref:NAD(P)-dependent oxidoreductase n=1 Tax=Enterococcus timonensis TaxID=1852364 RepID=UPI0008DAAFA5|nr:NAD(P)-dependent oxidoreductase [Enterococcus timonensis]